MKVVLHKHEARLRKVFAFFAALDVSLAGLSGKAQNTMNIKETCARSPAPASRGA